LRDQRARLVAQGDLRAGEFGAALSDAVDEAFESTREYLSVPGRWALVALGSYARRELCPGSDIDVVLLHDGAAHGEVGSRAAETLWYPLWDAGFVLGHAVRTPKEALSLAGDDLDALTALLDGRRVLGDDELAGHVIARARSLVQKRRRPLIDELAAAAAARFERPGPVAEMLEPNLKEGAGGLRDIHALDWAGWTLGDPGGLDALVAHGYLQPADPTSLRDARERLLDARVALHRVTGARSDTLTLQEQDAVAHAAHAVDADDLVRSLAASARVVTWIAGDVWRRLGAAQRGPARRAAARERTLAEGVVLRDGAVALDAEVRLDAATVFRAAAAAARLDIPLGRASLERMRALEDATWGTAAREAFIDLLRAGRAAIPVVESLDQVGALVTLVPEWAHVRARPQRNAYHRFTVDRHLLEAVAECAAILEDPGFDGEVARRTRPELLLLGALLHDIGKGMPRDHSEAGAATARAFAQRIGLDGHGVDVVAWLVRNHLLLAETATRRDLSDDETTLRFARAVHDTERLDLLYALTIGDSRATGPAAWSTAKAALVRQLFVETDALFERGVIGTTHDAERRDVLARHADLLAGGELAVEWRTGEDELLECVVTAPDRTGLLATVTGVLAVHGFDIRRASAYGAPGGMALEVFRGVDRFGRLDDEGRAAVEADIAASLSGGLALDQRLDERIRRYPARGSDAVEISFDLDASSAATVVEVHAPDQVGLLAKLAAVFADLGLDVSAAIVSTLGDRVVDVFYLRDEHGAKLTAPLTLERLRATLVARLTADYLVP